MQVHHMKFVIGVGRAIASEGLSVIKSIWGKETKRHDAINRALEKYSCILICESFNAQYGRPCAKDVTIVDYTMSPSDIVLTIENRIKFGGPLEMVMLDNLDYSGLSTSDASALFSLLKKTCEENGISALVISSYFNKPSYTEHLFCGEGIEEKIPTWDINPEYAPLKEHFDELNARALIDYGCC